MPPKVPGEASGTDAGVGDGADDARRFRAMTIKSNFKLLRLGLGYFSYFFRPIYLTGRPPLASDSKYFWC